MATLYDIKPWFQSLLRPKVADLAAAGITANEVTLVALAMSVGVGALFWALPNSSIVLLLVVVALAARMALNAVDGMLAREHGHASPLGALLNEIADLASDAALYLPLGLVVEVPATLAVLAAVLGLIVEGTGLAALLVGAPRGYQGPMGKSDRAFAFGLLAFLLALGLAGSILSTLILLLISGLAIWTIRNRVVAALDHAGSATP
ncbi:MAG: CDP-alcohol phosphatidyltransferase family protein [Hyphomicrobiaceae bacterium]